MAVNLSRNTAKCLFRPRTSRVYSSLSSDSTIPASKQKLIPESGTYPKGFLIGTGHAGVKASNKSRDDVAIVASPELCYGIGLFTSSHFQAAPVTVSKAISLRNTGKNIRGVVVNSGCANAVTGEEGLDHAKQMSQAVDEHFSNLSPNSRPNDENTFVMSTGVIGQKLPIDRIIPTIKSIASNLSTESSTSHESWLKLARAIMTTDTFPKLVSKTFTLPSHPSTTYNIAGVAKGAGMIAPNMGTLLGIICTDTAINQPALQMLSRRAVGRSFNSISVDGEMSTNDTIIILANGAGTPTDGTVKSINHTEDDDAKVFGKVLSDVMEELARLVVRDGEGATKFVTIHVNTDMGSKFANAVGKRIGRSMLVKTALYGRDANWGRILSALGDLRDVVPEKVSVGLGRVVKESDNVKTTDLEEVRLVENGQPLEVNEEEITKLIEMEEIHIMIRIVQGGLAMKKKARKDYRFWTCDLSHDYVTINGDYRT